MDLLYGYSLAPVFAVAILLAFSALERRRKSEHKGYGLVLYCLSIANWVAALVLAFYDETAFFGRRLAGCGAFIAAGYLHVAYELAGEKRFGLVWLSYMVATVITIAGEFVPGLLYDPVTLAMGPFFWSGMVLAVGGATLPLWRLAIAYRNANAERRVMLLQLFASGILLYVGGWSNAILLASGLRLPWGLYFILASLFLTGYVVRAQDPRRLRKVLDRSLLYSAVSAFLSGGFMFGIFALIDVSDLRELKWFGNYRWGTLLLLLMAALAFEPIRRQIQLSIGRLLFRDRYDAETLAGALEGERERADHATKMAELGVFASAVAHEVRNPLGVMSASLKLLSRNGADPETIGELKQQISRAQHFIDDLLKYGRPRPLNLRLVDLDSTVQLAYTTALQAMSEPKEPAFRFEIAPGEGGAIVEGDQAQLLQVFVVLFENAILAVQSRDERAITARLTPTRDSVAVSITDNGGGVSEDIAPRVFEPFVSGRKRSEGGGTGLGLAIARNVIDRHHGSVGFRRAEPQGAEFEVSLPRSQPLLVANTGQEDAQHAPA